MGKTMTDIAQKQERFLALLQPHHDNLARFARAMCKTDEEARDVVSDTIEQAFRNLHKLKHNEAFLSWIFTIASRIEKRRRWRERLFERFDPTVHDSDDCTALHTDSNAEAVFDTKLLYDALQRLPFKQREAFTLFEISGFSLQEIQELQGDSLSAVKMRLLRARETLRSLLGEADHPNRATMHHLSSPTQIGVSIREKR
jgi:RNA polymerase sigma-70 factor (ECF subfamily)